MPPASTTVETSVSPTDDGLSTITFAVAVACLIWYSLVPVVCAVGYTQIWRHYSQPKPRVVVQPDTSPDVTIIRPVKGLEPRLYDCLASTFRQEYPRAKLHVRFCVSDRTDPSIPVIKQVLEDFPGFDARLLLEDDDDALNDGGQQLGPNPKIRNMSRAYREAVGDIIWIHDCNVWVAKGVCARMVNKLEGRGEKHRYKFVHQLPITVDIDGSASGEESRALLSDGSNSHAQIRTTSSASATVQRDSDRNASSVGGGRMDENFMASAHGKFYTAINTVLVAPCIMGKSTMFRKSHLDSLTNHRGIDTFSENICEDHLIGDILWKKQVPEELSGEVLGKHALCFGDLAVQPIANMSVAEYWSRRVRWLRVRKFTVTLATLVEPGTESFLCSLYGAFALTTLPQVHETLGIPQTWTAFALIWLISVSAWCLMDWTLYKKLHSAASIDVDENTPYFAQPPNNRTRRTFGEWLFAWLGRESLAFPIWFWAFFGGTTVEWRGKKFWVGFDMKVHEIKADSVADNCTDRNISRSNSKSRQD